MHARILLNRLHCTKCLQCSNSVGSSRYFKTFGPKDSKKASILVLKDYENV